MRSVSGLLPVVQFPARRSRRRLVARVRPAGRHRIDAAGATPLLLSRGSGSDITSAGAPSAQIVHAAAAHGEVVRIVRVAPRDELPGQEVRSGCFGSSRWPSTMAAATSASLVLARRDWSRIISKASKSSTE
jgi:hypothetical protein